MHHCFLDPTRYKGQDVIFSPFPESWINAVALSMKICVGLFVFLSAYGITISYKKCSKDYNISIETVKALILKRLVSLWGGFLVVFGLVNIYDVVFVGDARFTRVYGHGLRSILYFVVDGIGLAEFFRSPTYLATFWYMSLAILLVLVLPICIYFYKKWNGITLVLIGSMIFALLFPISAKAHYVYLPNYLFCICLGMWIADRNILSWLKDYKIKKDSKIINRVGKFIITIVLVVVMVYLRQKTRAMIFLPVWEGAISLAICYFMFDFINNIFFIGKVFEVLGKYSMNIFLIHNFIRVIWYYDFTYGFRYWWLVVLVLLGISFIISFIIEWFKGVSGYNKFLNKIKTKIVIE